MKRGPLPDGRGLAAYGPRVTLRRSPSRPVRLVAAALFACVWGLAPVAAAPVNPALGDGVCGLVLPEFDAMASRECIVCHQRIAHGLGHAYEVHYPRLGTQIGMVLRPLAEVQRRGVPVPDGRLACVTCHDRFSPWKFKLRVPPGATPTHAVDVARAETYEAGLRPRPPVRPGDDVGRKPLCLACHALD